MGCSANRWHDTVIVVCVAVPRIPYERRVFRGWRAVSTFRVRDRGRAGAVSRTTPSHARHSCVRWMCIHKRSGLRPSHRKSVFWLPRLLLTLWWRMIIIIIIISGFGIYGLGLRGRQHLATPRTVLHEFLSNGLTPSRLHIVISFLTHADHIFLGLPRSLVPGSPKRVMESMHHLLD